MITTPGEHRHIPLHQLQASPFNRKRFDAAKMAELTQNVGLQGIIVPIVARPLPAGGGFEIVAGERRYRAAKAAGLVDIPAIVRELTDAQALELQVIENGQREDVHPLEEAEGYERLMKCAKTDGTQYTADDIALKVGKSRSYVFNRLKLTAMCPEAREAFFADKIDASKGLLIARIGHHDTQRQALKDITGGRYGGDNPMSYREAHQHILQTYMLKLSAAPFDIKDAGLNVKAGACGPCPKRTGNQAELFNDVKSGDVCTDPKCFDDKRKAHYRTAVVSLEAQGYKVIAGDAAKKVVPHWEHGGSYLQLNGYQRMEDTTYATGRTTKVSALLGKDFQPVKLQHPLTGEIYDIASSQAIAAAATKAKRNPSSSKARTGSAGGKANLSAKEVLEERLQLEIFKKLPQQLGRAELQMLAQEGLMNTDGVEMLGNELFPRTDGKRHDWRSAEQAIKKGLPKMALGDLCRITVFMTLITSCYSEKLLEDAARRYKVDPNKVKKAIAEEAKAKTAAAKPAKTKLPVNAAAKKQVGKSRGRQPDFMKPMQPSALLAAITGDKPMPRTEVTSKVWGYIKKNDLQDKTNRRMINCDAKLSPLMGNKKQVSMFEMTKYLAKQISKAKA